MAACDLSIELEEAGKTYCDGEAVRGVVVVRVEKDLRCKRLVVTSQWVTHGRGNIDRGEAATVDAFDGHWVAGNEYRYPFELATAPWPPTYYGTLLNVSHQVHARAQLAWALDPKVSQEFRVVAKQSPHDLRPTPKAGKSGVVGWIVVAVLLTMVGFAFLFLVPFLLILGGIVWFFKVYLPRSITGKVETSVEPKRLKAGESLKGAVRFTPWRKSAINGISCTIRCEEVCVSGSGSNRRTHRHQLFSQEIMLAEAGNVLAGTEQDLSFEFAVPASSAPSLDLSDNDIVWNAEIRIDIPRWPDFTERIPLIVEPSQDPPAWSPAESTEPTQKSNWLTQVIAQLVASKRDSQRLAMVLEAVQEHHFQTELRIGERVPRPTVAEQIHGGRWFAAASELHEVTFALYFDDEMEVPEPPAIWNGRFTIIDFAAEEKRVIAQAVRN